MTVPMALIDFIPVLFFLVSAISLQRDLYSKMSKGAFALFSAGTIMVIFAGLYKATWKLLYSANVCDFERLNLCFMPMQATGFFLVACALIAMFFFPQSKGKTNLYSAAPAVFAGTMMFVPMMVIGIGTMYASLAWFGAKLKKTWLIPLQVIGFIALLAMGYLSTKDNLDPMINWMAEGCNLVGQASLLIGARVLHKAGLAEFKLKEKN